MFATMLLAAVAAFGGPDKNGPESTLPPIVTAFGLEVVPSIQGTNLPITTAFIGIPMHDEDCDGCDPRFSVTSGGLSGGNWGKDSAAGGPYLYFGHTFTGGVEFVLLDPADTSGSGYYEGDCEEISAVLCLKRDDEDTDSRCWMAWEMEFDIPTGWRVYTDGGDDCEPYDVEGPTEEGIITVTSFQDCSQSEDVTFEIQEKVGVNWQHRFTVTVTVRCTDCKHL